MPKCHIVNFHVKFYDFLLMKHHGDELLTHAMKLNSCGGAGTDVYS